MEQQKMGLDQVEPGFRRLDSQKAKGSGQGLGSLKPFETVFSKVTGHLGQAISELEGGVEYGELEQDLQNKNKAFLDNNINRLKGPDNGFKGFCRFWCFESALQEAIARTFLTAVGTWAANLPWRLKSFWN